MLLHPLNVPRGSLTCVRWPPPRLCPASCSLITSLEVFPFLWVVLMTLHVRPLAAAGALLLMLLCSLIMTLA